MLVTWLTKAAITSESADRVTVRMPSGRLVTLRVKVWKLWNITDSSALSSGVAFSPC